MLQVENSLIPATVTTRVTTHQSVHELNYFTDSKLEQLNKILQSIAPELLDKVRSENSSAGSEEMSQALIKALREDMKSPQGRTHALAQLYSRLHPEVATFEMESGGEISKSAQKFLALISAQRATWGDTTGMEATSRLEQLVADERLYKGELALRTALERSFPQQAATLESTSTEAANKLMIDSLRQELKSGAYPERDAISRFIQSDSQEISRDTLISLRGFILTNSKTGMPLADQKDELLALVQQAAQSRGLNLGNSLPRDEHQGLSQDSGGIGTTIVGGGISLVEGAKLFNTLSHGQDAPVHIYLTPSFDKLYPKDDFGPETAAPKNLTELVQSKPFSDFLSQMDGKSVVITAQSFANYPWLYDRSQPFLAENEVNEMKDLAQTLKTLYPNVYFTIKDWEGDHNMSKELDKTLDYEPTDKEYEDYKQYHASRIEGIRRGSGEESNLKYAIEVNLLSHLDSGKNCVAKIARELIQEGRGPDLISYSAWYSVNKPTDIQRQNVSNDLHTRIVDDLTKLSQYIGMPMSQILISEFGFVNHDSNSPENMKIAIDTFRELGVQGAITWSLVDIPETTVDDGLSLFNPDGTLSVTGRILSDNNASIAASLPS